MKLIIQRGCGHGVRLTGNVGGPIHSLGKVRPITAGLRIVARISLACAALCPSLAQRPIPDPLPPGQILNVSCEKDFSQSYALYLPSNYSGAQRWPILYFFDPGGRGRLPVELYKQVAEKYGFVMAGSNNSRNFGADESRALNAIWLDTHSRVALDERRTYTSGFSGGARVAGSMALQCSACQISGVIAQGAGYPADRTAAKDALLYFFAIGDRDFNWPEIMQVRREREDAGLTYRVRVFAGPHQWAPADVMEDAVQWLQLRAMQSGNLKPDAALIDRMFQQTETAADDASQKGDAIAQLAAYRSLLSDFAGLKDVAGFQDKLAALKKSPALKSALKKEKDQATEQDRLGEEIQSKFKASFNGPPDDAGALGNAVLGAMSQLHDRSERSKNETERLVSRRALDGVWIRAIERGQQELDSGHLDRAEACFQLMSQLSKEAWPVLLLAETHAMRGAKNLALKDLRQAVQRGLTDPKILESDDRLQSLKTDPNFQKLVAELKQK